MRQGDDPNFDADHIEEPVVFVGFRGPAQMCVGCGISLPENAATTC